MPTLTRSRKSFRPQLTKRVPQRINLAFLVDRTGSSKPFVAGIERIVAAVLALLQAMGSELAVSVQSHGDRDEGQTEILHVDRGDARAAAAAIKGITFAGGGDPPEHHLDAFSYALENLQLEDDPLIAQGILLAFTTADSKPHQGGKTPTQIGEEIKRKRLTLLLVSEPAAGLQELVTAAAGFGIPITNSPTRAELEGIQQRLNATLSATVGSGTIQMP